MKVVQQLTCLTLGRHNGPAYSTGELLNTPQISYSKDEFLDNQSDIQWNVRKRWNMINRLTQDRQTDTLRNAMLTDNTERK